MAETSDAPALVDLLDYLRTRYEAATDQRDDLLAAPSLVDALCSTVQLAWAPRTVSVRVVPMTGSSGHDTLLWLLDGVTAVHDPFVPSFRDPGQPGVVGSLEVWKRDTQLWDEAADHAEGSDERDYILYRVLRMARVDMYSADDVVTTDKALDAYPDAFLETVASLWCESRFPADVDVETMEAMFALMAHPQVHTRVGRRGWLRARRDPVANEPREKVDASYATR